jgi:hypothetical protein
VGTKCDGSSCPPGNIVDHPVSDQASQNGLAGVLGGSREAVLTRTSGNANAVIVQGFFTHNHDAGASSTTLEARYGMAADLNVDLTVGGATGLEVNLISGDLDSGPRPVPVTITVTSGRGTANETTASSTQSMVSEGIYLFLFTDFTGVDFTDVDRLTYFFDASQVVAVDYALGPFKTDEPPVQTVTSSWGSVKAIYR